MYTRQEASKIKEEFWTTFGRYLAPVPSSEGIKINWVNYKTGIKDVKFTMDADATKAVIGIRILHTDSEIQQIFFEEFIKLRPVLENLLEEKWKWVPASIDEYGKENSNIYRELDAVNIYNKEDWPSIISFLKPRLILLDKFWNEWKYSFEDLV